MIYLIHHFLNLQNCSIILFFAKAPLQLKPYSINLQETKVFSGQNGCKIIDNLFVSIKDIITYKVITIFKTLISALM